MTRKCLISTEYRAFERQNRENFSASGGCNGHTEEGWIRTACSERSGNAFRPSAFGTFLLPGQLSGQDPPVFSFNSILENTRAGASKHTVTDSQARGASLQVPADAARHLPGDGSKEEKNMSHQHDHSMKDEGHGGDCCGGGGHDHGHAQSGDCCGGGGHDHGHAHSGNCCGGGSDHDHGHVHDHHFSVPPGKVGVQIQH